MWSNNAALEHGSGPRLLEAVVAGLGGLLADDHAAAERWARRPFRLTA
jgi:hypothetical protein